MENPKKDKVDALLEEIKKYPDLRPRLAFLFPLSEGRKNALDMLESGEITNLKKVEELLESKDFIEREAGFYILGNSFYRDTGISAKMKNLLDAIYEEKYKKEDLADSVKMNVLIASHKEKAFPKIEKIIGQGLTSERLAAVRALIFGGIDKNKAIGFLEKTDFSNNYWARESIAEGLDIFGEESLPLLEKFISDKDNNIKIRAIKTKIGIITASQKEKALPFLEKMAHYDDWRVRMAVVANLLSIGDAASSLLEELLNDEIPDVRRKAEEISNILKHEPHKWLLGS
ncbi:MAG: HEAT repeat domain-containing protein, partial [Patescibacteria group bacterium]